MFSRRKLFRMAGLGAAAVVTARVLPASPVDGLNWTADELAILESFGPPIVTMRDGLASEQELNRRRLAVIRDYVRFNKFGPYSD